MATKWFGYLRGRIFVCMPVKVTAIKIMGKQLNRIIFGVKDRISVGIQYKCS